MSTPEPKARYENLSCLPGDRELGLHVVVAPNRGGCRHFRRAVPALRMMFTAPAAALSPKSTVAGPRYTSILSTASSGIWERSAPDRSGELTLLPFTRTEDVLRGRLAIAPDIDVRGLRVAEVVLGEDARFPLEGIGDRLRAGGPGSASAVITVTLVGASLNGESVREAVTTIWSRLEGSFRRSGKGNRNQRA